MSIRVQNNGTLRTITGITVKQAGVARDIRTVKVQSGGTLRTVAIFATPLSLSISPESPNGAANSTGSVLVTTSSTTATPSGGVSPFTYLWERTGGVSATINSPTSSATTFSYITGPGESAQATFQCTVSDSFGQQATDTVTATFNNIGTGGPI